MQDFKALLAVPQVAMRPQTTEAYARRDRMVPYLRETHEGLLPDADGQLTLGQVPEVLQVLRRKPRVQV